MTASQEYLSVTHCLETSRYGKAKQYDGMFATACVSWLRYLKVCASAVFENISNRAQFVGKERLQKQPLSLAY
jgi:hypothetical protein